MVAGKRASSVDGELPWRCCGRWTVRWTAVKGNRDRSSGRAAAVASTPGSRAQARRMAGFLVYATKPSWRTAVEDAKSWRHGRRSQDWRRNGRRRHLGSRCGRGGDGRRTVSRAVRRPRRERRPGPRRESSRAWSFGCFLKTGHLPRVSRTLQNADRIFIYVAASRRRLRFEERTSAVG